jgi:hypothetical protein
VRKGNTTGMNYLAHGIRFLDRPYLMAGTAVPDWLSVVDRRVRMRAKRVEPLLEQWVPGTPEHETALGILQHLSDDDWFHTTVGFHDVTARLTALFRRQLPGDQYINGFLGHIVTELLIDAELSHRQPDLLEGYYSAMSSVDPRIIQTVVNTAAREPTDQLALFIPLFVQERFLHDYREAKSLLRRLNQVMKRVKLQPLPDSIVEVLGAGRELVASQLQELLPAQHFAQWTVISSARS